MGWSAIERILMCCFFLIVIVMARGQDPGVGLETRCVCGGGGSANGLMFDGGLPSMGDELFAISR
jgi:hypothetical protein